MENTNPIDALFTSAKQHRVPMSLICQRAGVDPTTPSRWKRKKNGATVEVLHKLTNALSAILDERKAA